MDCELRWKTRRLTTSTPTNVCVGQKQAKPKKVFPSNAHGAGYHRPTYAKTAKSVDDEGSQLTARRVVVVIFGRDVCHMAFVEHGGYRSLSDAELEDEEVRGTRANATHRSCGGY